MRKVFLAVFLALTALFMALAYVNACTNAYASACTNAYANAYTNVHDNGTDTPPEVPWEEINAVWVAAKATSIGVVVAFAVTLVGYLSKTEPEKFRLDYFIFTALISFVVGLVTIVVKLPYDQWYSWLANGFLTWYFWKIARIAAKILAKKLSWATGPGPPNVPTA